jgi:hypothetical protein
MFRGYFADYPVVTEPKELAAQSAIVVSGTISRIVEGRTQVIDDVSGFTDVSIVAEVEVSKAHHGALPKDSGGTVYVELPRIGETSATDYDVALPDDNAAVLYLVESRPGDETIENPQAGRPLGQPILAPTTPQGFWMATPEGSVLVLEGELSTDSLNEALPGSDEFPEFVAQP